MGSKRNNSNQGLDLKPRVLRWFPSSLPEHKSSKLTQPIQVWNPGRLRSAQHRGVAQGAGEEPPALQSPRVQGWKQRL